MITAELARKIETLSIEEYHMVEAYVDYVMEYSRLRGIDDMYEIIYSPVVQEKLAVLKSKLTGLLLQRHKKLWNIGRNERED